MNMKYRHYLAQFLTALLLATLAIILHIFSI